MKKSMRKADTRLTEARKYVASYTAPDPVPEVETIKIVTKPRGVKVERAEIKKLEKGHFFVVVTCHGQRYEIQKRFKSTTKAQEWISKHEYIEI